MQSVLLQGNVARGITDSCGHCLCGWWRSSCSHDRSNNEAQGALTGSVTPDTGLLNVFLSAKVLRTSRCVSVPRSSTSNSHSTSS